MRTLHGGRIRRFRVFAESPLLTAHCSLLTIGNIRENDPGK